MPELIDQIPADRIEDWVDGLTPEQAERILFDWDLWARDNQRLPGTAEWITWLIISGRGYGKTRTGAESIRRLQESGKYHRFGLVGRTASDVRDTMIEGESGILAISPHWNRPKYESSKRRITWPNGAIATAYSAEKPDQLRGPQHDAVWGDEMAAWGKRVDETYSNIQFGLRLGQRPIQIYTTTPRPVSILRKLVKRWKEEDPAIYVTEGSSYENRDNLTPQFYSEVIAPFIGTEIGRQEIYGQLLEEAEGALWKRAHIDNFRVEKVPATLRTIVVAVDPAGGGGDEIGIVVCARGTGDHWYVLEDASMRGTPEAWGRRVLEMYSKWQADYVVAEVNYGGEMVQSTIRVASSSIPVQVVTASRGKAPRAQPIAFAYSKGQVHHVREFDNLEDQMVNWVPEEANWSPDRMDALVWGLTALKVGLTGGGLSGIRL